jgi:hypothetical protein
MNESKWRKATLEDDKVHHWKECNTTAEWKQKIANLVFNRVTCMCGS